MLSPLPAEAPVILPAGLAETVQAYVVAAVVLDNPIDEVPSEHKVCAGGVATATGVGLTVITTSIGGPTHAFAVGVMV